jgi:hypothetical protein
VKGELYRQVLLRRPVEGGFAEDVFWIPNAMGKLNKRLIDDADIIWIVAEVYNTQNVRDVDRYYRVWREFAETLGS